MSALPRGPPFLGAALMSLAGSAARRSPAPLVRPDGLEGAPPLRGRLPDGLLEAARDRGHQCPGVRVAVAGALHVDAPGPCPEAVRARAQAGGHDQRPIREQCQRGRTGWEGGRMPEERCGDPVAGQVAVRDERHDLAPAQGLDHGPAGTRERDHPHRPTPRRAWMNSYSSGGLDLLDRRGGRDPVLRHEGPVRLEVAQVRNGDDHPGAQDRLPAVPLPDLELLVHLLAVGSGARVPARGSSGHAP